MNKEADQSSEHTLANGTEGSNESVQSSKKSDESLSVGGSRAQLHKKPKPAHIKIKIDSQTSRPNVKSPRSALSPTADFSNVMNIGEVFHVFASPTSPVYPILLSPLNGRNYDFDDLYRSPTDTNKTLVGTESTKGDDWSGSEEDKVGDLKKRDDDRTITFFSVYSLNCSELILVILGVLSAIVFGSILPASAYIYGLVYAAFQNYQNGLLTQDDFMKSIKEYCIYSAIIAGSFFTFGFLRNYIWLVAGIRQYMSIRQKLFAKMILKDVEWFDIEEVNNNSSARSLMSESLKIQTAFTYALPTAISSAMTCLIALGLALYCGWKLALVVFSITIAVGFLTNMVKGITKNVLARNQELSEQHHSRITEVLSNFAFVLSMNATEYEKKENQKISLARKGVSFSLLTRWGIFMAAGQFFYIASFAVTYWYGAVLVIGDEISGAVVLQVLSLAMMSFDALIRVMDCVPLFLEANVILKRIGNIIKRAPHIDITTDGLKLEDPKFGEILLLNVSFAYPSRRDLQILKNVTMEFKQGQITGVVGYSGSGKSTISQLIERFYDPQKGQVLLHGTPYQELNLKWLRDQISIVSQEPFLYECTIAENLSMARVGDIITELEMVEACKIAQIHDFIDSLPQKYFTPVGSIQSSLSGGQSQRIMIARALLKNSPILILDEATSYLDPESESELFESLRAKIHGKTVIVIAHRFTSLKHADYVYVMSEGVVAERGTVKELMEIDGIFTQLANATKAVVRNQKRANSIDASSEAWKKSSDIRLSTNNNRTSSDLNGNLFNVGRKKIIKVVTSCKYNNLLLFMAFFLSAIVGACFPVFAFLYGKIIGIYAVPDKEYIRQEAKMGSLYFIALAVGMGFSGFVRNTVVANLGASITHSLRMKSFDNVIHKPLYWFDSSNRAPIVVSRKIAIETTTFQLFFMNVLPAFIEALVIGVLCLSIAFYYGAKLAAFIIGGVPIILLASRFSVNSASNLEEKLLTFYNEAEKFAQAYLSNIRTVCAFNLHEFASKTHGHLLRTGIQSSRGKRSIIALGAGIGESVVLLAEAATFYWGATLLSNGEYTFQDILIVFTSIALGANGMTRINRVIPDLSKLSASSSQLTDVLKTIDSSVSPSKAPKSQKLVDDTDIAMKQGKIQFSKVSFAYPSRPKETVLNNLSFKVAPREKLAIVGPSGSGKSTIVLLLEQLYRPSSGSIFYANQNAKELDLETVRDNLGWVSQFPVLFNRTIKDNLLYGNWRVHPGNDVTNALRRACEFANILDFIESLPEGFDTVVGEKGRQLSGGQRQRIALARVFLRNPPIYILDEYTASLDNQNEKEIIEAVNMMVKDKTTIIVTHRAATLAIADSVMVIEKGRLKQKILGREIENFEEFLNQI